MGEGAERQGRSEGVLLGGEKFGICQLTFSALACGRTRAPKAAERERRRREAHTTRGSGGAS